MYDHLFVKEEPSDETWEADLNPGSEVVMRSALAAPTLLSWNPKPEMHFQVLLLHHYITLINCEYSLRELASLLWICTALLPRTEQLC